MTNQSWERKAGVALIFTLGLLCSGYSSAQDQSEFIGAKACIACHESGHTCKDNIHVLSGMGIESDKTCETCHGPGSLHAAAAKNKDDIMYFLDFYSVKNPKTLPTKEANDLCLGCHKGGELFKWAGSAHDSRDISCMACHTMLNTPHSDDNKFLLNKPTVIETCFQCHNTRKAQFQRSSHMPMREGKIICSNCHNPHGGQGPTLLRQATANEVCLTCHSEKKGPFLWEHPPVRENCLNCHEPHGSQHDKLLKAKRPRLCQQCHVAQFHPTSPGDLTSIRLAGRSCTECHSQIHGSNHPSGVRFQR